MLNIWKQPHQKRGIQMGICALKRPEEKMSTLYVNILLTALL